VSGRPRSRDRTRERSLPPTPVRITVTAMSENGRELRREQRTLDGLSFDVTMDFGMDRASALATRCIVVTAERP